MDLAAYLAVFRASSPAVPFILTIECEGCWCSRNIMGRKDAPSAYPSACPDHTVDQLVDVFREYLEELGITIVAS